jgi:phosphohistidine phosphatase
MKTLLILRHAKSSWREAGLTDHQRPLNARGRRDAPRMGTLVRERGLVPDLIVSSDAVRAHATARAVSKAAGYPGKIQLDNRLYLAGPAEIVGLLQTLDDTGIGSVMIVGHNPGLEELASLLTGEPQHLPTAALVHVVLPIARWRDLEPTTAGRLAGIWRPKELS